MMNSHQDTPARGNWVSALAMLTLALLTVAALLNGIGPVGIMAPAGQGKGRYLSVEPLTAEEKVDFSRVERSLRRVPLEKAEHEEFLESVEPLLMALASALEDAPVIEGPALERARLLLHRSMPAPAARRVTEVLPDFLRYKRAETALFEYRPEGPQTIEGAYTQLKIQKALRQTALGPDVAGALYGTAHRLTEAHLARRMLMERQDLGDEEKRNMLEQQMEALAIPEPEGDAG